MSPVCIASGGLDADGSNEDLNGPTAGTPTTNTEPGQERNRQLS